MFEGLFQASPVTQLESALSASGLRHKVISNNIANVNTPGFKRSEVSFEGELTRALSNQSNLGLNRTNEKHFSGSTTYSGPRTQTSAETTMRTDGNNVDIDAEMAAMTKNNLYYNTVAHSIKKYYNNIQTAIRG